MPKFIRFLLVVSTLQILLALIVGFIAYEIEDYSSSLCSAVVALLAYITYVYLDDIVKLINSSNHNE